jgi:hypothetical protein
MGTINSTTTGVTTTDNASATLDLQSAGVTHISQDATLALVTYTTGGAAPPTPLTTTKLHVAGPNSASLSVLMDTFGGQTTYAGRRSEGTVASPNTTVPNGSVLVAMAGYGNDGTGYVTASGASIDVITTENWTATAHGAKARLRVTRAGSTTTSIVTLEDSGLFGWAQSADIASATTITPAIAGAFFRVTGTTAIVTIATTNIATGSTQQINIVPTGIFTWTTAGNIGLAGTAVVGKVLTFTWMPTQSKWYPSYTA